MSDEDILHPVRAQRLKRDALRAMDNPHFEGHAGALYQAGLLDETQLEAGALFGLLSRRYAVLMGIPLPTKVTIRLDKVMGRSIRAEPDPEIIERIRRDYNEAVKALKANLKEMNRVFVLGNAPEDITSIRSGTTDLKRLWGTGDFQLGASPVSKRIRRYMVAGAKPKDRPDLREESAA